MRPVTGDPTDGYVGRVALLRPLARVEPISVKNGEASGSIRLSGGASGAGTNDRTGGYADSAPREATAVAAVFALCNRQRARLPVVGRTADTRPDGA
ncbi:hypothetical protein NWFMUON74_56650 [Nocardia wallacei]|uniref:Uncharacterized protein n=1 Tax=Nocardia wallacei TaxID=480035 RepID=A0A7G1KUM5_9NOCA|nr:hypothetical protein NWFMUON74_56650 [Nocardia wallacei]